MTNPVSAISEDKHHLHGAGRLYGPEGFDVSRLKTVVDTSHALREGVIYPSVTNIISVLPKKHLQGWYGRESVKTLHATTLQVNASRQAALTAAAARGVSVDVIVAACDPNIPPSLIPSCVDLKTVEKARAMGARWVRVAALTLSGKHSPGHLSSVMTGGQVGAEKPGKAFYTRHMNGELTATELETAQALMENDVLDALREHADGWWVYSMLPGDTKGLALLGNAASRSRDTSADFGTEVHDLLERVSLLPDPLAPYTGEHSYHVKAFQKWWKTNQPTDCHPELTVRGKTLSGLPYAGTADLFAMIGGAGCVIDYKTSKQLDEGSVTLQMASLAHADEVPYQITSGIGLHVPRPADAQKLLRFARPSDIGYETYKDGYRAQHVNSDNLAAGWRLFSAARDLWQEYFCAA
jgi:hypothetical protein